MLAITVIKLILERKERTEVEMMSRCDPCRGKEGMKVEEKKIHLPYCPTDEDAPTMTIG